MSEESVVFLVPSDISGAEASDVRVLRNDERDDDTPSLGMPIDMIIEVVCILIKSRICPAHFLNLVLDLADIRTSFQSETEKRLAGFQDMNEAYLRLHLASIELMALPKGVSISKCECLVVDCTSKDQGWASSNTEYDGTYRHSWTWSEVVVEKPTRQASAGCSPGDSNEKSSGGSDGQSDEYNIEEPSYSVLQEEAGETMELARARVCYNVRASDTLRHHHRYFKDPDGLIQHIKPGNSAVLVLRSAFPGWKNTASYERLEAFFSLDFSPDFLAADVSSTTSLPLTMDDFSNPAFLNSCRVQ